MAKRLSFPPPPRKLAWRSTAARVTFWLRSIVIFALAGGAVALIVLAVLAGVWAKRGVDVSGRVLNKHIDRAGGYGLAGPATAYSIDYRTTIDGVDHDSNSEVDPRMLLALNGGPGMIEHVRVRVLKIGPWVYQDLRPADSGLWTKARNEGFSALLGVFVVSVLGWRHFVRHARMSRLLKFGEVAEGRVTSIARAVRRRQAVEYSFAANGADVAGRVFTSRKAIERMQEGTRVTVFYDSRDSKKSLLHETAPLEVRV